MDDERSNIAHLLRRVTFGPLPGQVDELAGGGYAGALERVLSAPPLGAFPDPGTTGDIAQSWMQWMRRPDAGLHEKMTWFWHGHLTTSIDAVANPTMLYRQHLLMRDHALGNVRELVRSITVDPAMLQYLSGDGSTADAPNENYSRELLELFTLGRGSYTQADVRAGSRALAGWSVGETGAAASFDAQSGYSGSLTYLGRTGVKGVDGVVEAIFEHPSCAPWIAARVHRFLAGVEPTPARRTELSGVLRDSGYEVRPLVEAIVRHPSFLGFTRNRPRFPVEWVTAATAALDIDTGADIAAALGQRPYSPPNVAGWPPGDRWLSATAALARSDVALGAAPLDGVAASADPVAAALDRCSLTDVSASTLATIRQAVGSATDPGARARLAMGLAVLSPEFCLA